MTGLPEDPARLCDQRDQPNLALRIAGQAARDLIESAQPSYAMMADIAARIDAGRMRHRRRAWVGWVLVTSGFVLGLVTAASAARLDLVPSWITRLTQGRSKSVSALPAAGAGKVRPPAEKSPAAPTPAGAAKAAVESPASAAPIGAAPSTTAAAAPARPAAAPATAPVAAAPPSPTTAVAPARPAAAPPPVRTAQATPAKRAVPLPPANGADARARGQLAFVPSAPTAAPALPQPASPLPWSPPGAGAVAASAEPAHSAAPPEPRPAPSARAERSSPAWPRVQEAAPPSTLSTAKHLKEIVHALRLEHSPKKALALLDRHASELSGDVFAEESLLLRVEAMLALGQRSAVLQLLDGISLGELAASRGLLVTRGELRAASNRCAEAVGDFDMALAHAGRPSKQALSGRARCKQKLGDAAGAAADLERYGREYPDDARP